MNTRHRHCTNQDPFKLFLKIQFNIKHSCIIKMIVFDKTNFKHDCPNVHAYILCLTCMQRMLVWLQMTQKYLQMTDPFPKWYYPKEEQSLSEVWLHNWNVCPPWSPPQDHPSPPQDQSWDHDKLEITNTWVCPSMVGHFCCWTLPISSLLRPSVHPCKWWPHLLHEIEYKLSSCPFAGGCCRWQSSEARTRMKFFVNFSWWRPRSRVVGTASTNSPCPHEIRVLAAVSQTPRYQWSAPYPVSVTSSCMSSDSLPWNYTICFNYTHHEQWRSTE